jgi:hypothetical protein
VSETVLFSWANSVSEWEEEGGIEQGGGFKFGWWEFVGSAALGREHPIEARLWIALLFPFSFCPQFFDPNFLSDGCDISKKKVGNNEYSFIIIFRQIHLKYLRWFTHFNCKKNTEMESMDAWYNTISYFQHLTVGKLFSEVSTCMKKDDAKSITYR